LPNVNLISNIGFGEQALHCIEEDSLYACAESKSILPLRHPKEQSFVRMAKSNQETGLILFPTKI